MAPMDDVTDTVFRQIIVSCAVPDVFFTEFVNVDGLQSPGREKLLHKLRFSSKEKPILVQLWGKNPENFHKTARQIADGSILDEINWLTRRSGSSKMLGNDEERTSRTSGTVSEFRKKMTKQFTESDGGVSGSAREQAVATSTSGGFAGVDLNFGCPVRVVMKNGCGAIMINNRELVGEIIQATREAVGDHFPVSVKTRLGLKEVDYSWFEFLLKQKLNMLTIHGRTASELSKVPADWGAIGKIRELRDKLSSSTLIVGNGDVMTRAQGLKFAAKYSLDGIMIGRGVFSDPYVFSESSPWLTMSKEEKIGLYKNHVQLFGRTWKNNERKVKTLNKFCKIYINGFDGAKELREKLMKASSAEEILKLLK